MIDFKLTSSGEIRFNCPFCVEIGKPPDSKYHLYVNPRKGVFHCFRCGKSGSLSILPKHYVQTIMSVSSKIVDFEKVEEVEEVKLSFPNGYQKVAGQAQLISEMYLAMRLGISIEDLKTKIPKEFYSIVVNKTNSDIWLMFKSYTWAGDMDYYVLRKVGKHDFLNPSGVKKPLFKFSITSLGLGKPLFITEGIMDALSVYKEYNCPSVALLSKTITHKQLLELYDYSPETVVVALDGDAQKEAFKLCRKLQSFIDDVFVALLPEDKDPADLHGKILEYIFPYYSGLELIKFHPTKGFVFYSLLNENEEKEK